MPAEAWRRPRHTPTEATASVRFLVFLDIVPQEFLDLTQEGWRAAGAPEGLQVAAAERPLDPDKEAFVEGFFDWLGDHPDAARLREARVVAGVEGEGPDTADLDLLQASWAAVRWLCRRGAIGVWDVPISAWRPAAEVLAAPAGDPTLATAWDLAVYDVGAMWVVHTLGMGKFARRELLAFAAPGAEEDVAALVEALAGLQAGGVALQAGDVLEQAPLRVRIEAYNPGFNAPPVDVPFADQPLLVVIEAG